VVGGYHDAGALLADCRGRGVRGGFCFLAPGTPGRAQ